MTLDEIRDIVAHELDWLIDDKYKNVLRRDIDIHIAEAVYTALARESGEEAEHHAAGRYWNASSGTYDEGGCW
jgi:hypothetical protein